MKRKRKMSNAELLETIDRLCPPIERESELMAERDALARKEELEPYEAARYRELVRIVGHSKWNDDVRGLLRRMKVKLCEGKQ